MDKEKLMNLIIENLRKRKSEPNTDVTIMKLRGDRGLIGEVKNTSKEKSYSFRIEFEKGTLTVSQNGNSLEIALGKGHHAESFLKRFSASGIVFKDYKRTEALRCFYNGEVPLTIKLGGYFAILTMDNVLPTVTEQMLINVRNLLYSDPSCEHFSYATYSYMDDEVRKNSLMMVVSSVRDNWFGQLSDEYVEGKIENLWLSNGMSPLQYADPLSYKRMQDEEIARKKWQDITGNHGRGR